MQKKRMLVLTVSSLLLVVAKSDAQCGCPKIRRPVCASDGVTYDNECLMRCESNNKKYDICDQPAEPGDCKVGSARWYYNKDEEACLVFRGCGGIWYDNNFDTEQDCKQRCMQPKKSEDLKVIHCGECGGKVLECLPHRSVPHHAIAKDD